MEQYKPGYLGKVIPADDQSKMTDFVINKYDAFSKTYDNIKDQSEKIDDVKVVDSGSSDPTVLSVKVSTDKETLEKIKETASGDSNITVKDDVITAKSNDT